MLAVIDSAFVANTDIPATLVDPPTPGSLDSFVALCFRSRTSRVPSYLVNRYITHGAVPMCPGAPPPYTGQLRSFVVDRGGGLLDFYYQLVNTTVPSGEILAELFRIKTFGGFNTGLVISVGQTNSLTGLFAGTGSGFVAGSYTVGSALKPSATADRDVATSSSMGFNFPFSPAFIGNSLNLHEGEASSFLVVRTNATTFGTGQVVISGGTSAVANALVPNAPEIAVEQPVGTNLPDGGAKSFGSVFVGSSSSLFFTIKNTGTLNLTGLGITKDGADAAMFTVTVSPTAPVGPSGSTTFIVQISPTSAGAKTAAIHIANNDVDETPFDITLTGNGIADPEIVVEQPAGIGLTNGASTISFGALAVGTSGVPMVVTIRNIGAATLSGLAVTLNGANASDFSTGSLGATTLASNASTTFSITFTPGAASYRVAALHIASNDADENPFDIVLAGRGGASVVDTDFNPNANSQVTSAALQADARVLLGGVFTTLANVSQIALARLEADGSLDAAYVPNPNSLVWSTAVQMDGKAVISGLFTTVSGTARNRVARIERNGLLDASFNPDVNDDVRSIAFQPDGKIVIGGNFTTVGALPRNRIARLNSDGTVDPTFNPDANDRVRGICVQPDGKIVIVGFFTTVGGVARNRIARLNSNGTLDGSFNPNANSQALTAILQPDGRIVIGGDFTMVQSVVRNKIARIEAGGGLDVAFNPNADNFVVTSALQADGKILIGGDFTSLGGVARSRIARLDSSGSLDTLFQANADNSVSGVTIQQDGKVIVTGSFTGMYGVARNRIARVLNDPATQSLAIPSVSRAEWPRGGSSPETHEVTFDLSTDGGANWASIGQGTPGRSHQMARSLRR